MIPFEELEGVFGKLPDEPESEFDEEKEKVLRVIAADTMRTLRFNGN